MEKENCSKPLWFSLKSTEGSCYFEYGDAGTLAGGIHATQRTFNIIAVTDYMRQPARTQASDLWAQVAPASHTQAHIHRPKVPHFDFKTLLSSLYSMFSHTYTHSLSSSHY